MGRASRRETPGQQREPQMVQDTQDMKGSKVDGSGQQLDVGSRGQRVPSRASRVRVRRMGVLGSVKAFK